MSISSVQTAGTWIETRFAKPDQTLEAIEFSFYPAYVEAVWSHAKLSAKAARTTREASDYYGDEFILLAKSVPLNGSSMFVRVTLIRSKNPDYYHMRVEINAPTKIKRKGRLILYWDGQTYIVPLRAGEMFFDDISLPDFSNENKNLPSRRMLLRVEFDQNDQNGAA